MTTEDLDTYSDPLFVRMQLMNATRRFKFALDSGRRFMKMLEHEKVAVVVMSFTTLISIRSLFWDRVENFGFIPDNRFMVFGRHGFLDNEFEDGLLLMANENGEPSVAELECDLKKRP